MNVATPHVQLIAWTHFEPPTDVPWSTDADGGQALAEFAGRACYQSWGKPNPVTATNAGYLDHILDVGHLSVLEHGTATMYFTGVARSFTHELIRHRHFSFSQLSQRYVDESNSDMIIPAVIAEDEWSSDFFHNAVETAQEAYKELVHRLDERLAERPDTASWSRTARRKAARQAARSVLPNATETRIVVTGNYRAFRHFIALRATEHADVEIRQVAIQVLRLLQGLAPNVFNDFAITELPDGTEVAASHHKVSA